MTDDYTILITCSFAYGRYVIKFIDFNAIFNTEWVLQAMGKNLSIVINAKRTKDEDKKFPADLAIHDEDGNFVMTLNCKTELPKQEASDVWDFLLQNGFAPTKETDKLLSKRNM